MSSQTRVTVGPLSLLLALAFLTGTSIPARAAGIVPAAPDAGQLLQVRVPAPSMRGNRLGTPDSLPIAVYLPPSYGTTARRYPVVYFLPGFGDRVRDFVSGPYGISLPDSIDHRVARGSVQELIVVVVNGFNTFGGSFYANSSVTGRWEDWVARDVVGWTDAHVRTVARREARGLAGHSMGGSGALRIGMKNADVFGAVYAMSPGLFAPGGLDSTLLVADSTARAVLREDGVMAATPDSARMDRLIADLRAQGWTQFFATAYGAAFSPDPSKPLPHVRWPYGLKDGRVVRDARAAQRWERGFGDLERMVKAHAAGLRRLRAIGIEYGDVEEHVWIPMGCRDLSARLEAHQIRHRLVQFHGAHDDQLGERLLGAMLPFFSAVLQPE